MTDRDEKVAEVIAEANRRLTSAGQEPLTAHERRAVELLVDRPWPIAPGKYPPGHAGHDAVAYAAWQQAHRDLYDELGSVAYRAWYSEAFPAAASLSVPIHADSGKLL